jgi:hypothetical protein
MSREKVAKATPNFQRIISVLVWNFVENQASQHNHTKPHIQVAREGLRNS